VKGKIALWLIGLYFAIGVCLEARTWKHVKNWRKVLFHGTGPLKPEFFTEEGQRAREIAMLYYVVAGGVLVLGLAVLILLSL